MKNPDYQQILTGESLEETDSFLQKLLDIEKDRQARKLVLIPSESVAPQSVREALGSEFQNIYAEGYPREEMTRQAESELRDLSKQLTHYRRYANRRFYKGTEYVDLIESLAQQRARECFSTDEVPPDQIYVNVQPLSGTAGNLAIYDTFVNPGETVMGLALDQGGHLSHGSEFNLTGKRYDIVSYSTDPQTERLDYDQIRELALEHQPKMIIAGYTSYSWAPDWEKFSDIADEVGAILLADISHTAGMAIAGSYPNPIGEADVIMTTTHKTIGGPRGAIILTTDREKAEWIDEAVFPGSQGGPHPNKFAAMSVAFKIAQTETFRKLQYRIVDNAKKLAESLKENGLKLAYRGTDTHLMVIDLTEIGDDTGFELMGEVASRILDLARIVSNKNTIPGDESAAVAHGLRVGTPWLTQRGMGEDEMEEIAEILADVLKGIKPFSYIGLTNPLSRGKLDMDLLLEARERVARLTDDFVPKPQGEETFPHFFSTEGKSPEEEERSEFEEPGVIKVAGHRPEPFLEQVGTRRLFPLEEGSGKTSALLGKDGSVMDVVEVVRRDEDSFLVLTSKEEERRLVRWFRGISDGYIVFDEKDLMRKVEGPITVKSSSELEKEIFIGPYRTDSLLDHLGSNEKLEPGEIKSCSLLDNDVSVYRSEADPKKSYILAPSQSGGEKIEKAGLETFGETSAVKENGEELFRDRPGLFELSKPYFVGQNVLEERLEERELPEAKDRTFSFQPSEGETKKTPLFGVHEELGARTAEFAGYEMPFWYTTVAEEHEAVREAAGLFDVGHMGVYGIYGPNATKFLDLVTSNYVRWLEDNEAQYTYILDENGRPMDDSMLYRIREDHYLWVVNAVNQEKNWQWLKAVNQREVKIDPDRPWIRSQTKAALVNLKGPEAGEDALIDLALQGPKSRVILSKLLDDEEEKEKLSLMERNQVYSYHLSGAKSYVAHTGYTGEEIGYELLVPPEEAPKIFCNLLEQGEEEGIKPAGLGARDSTRIEAGLPLYGHELAGEYEVSPTEAGFGAYIKFHKPYFVGRDVYKGRAESKEQVDREIVRFQVTDPSARMVREQSPVFDRRGSYIGRVTSCAKAGDMQVGMALIEERDVPEEGASLKIAPSLAGEEKKTLKLQPNERIPLIYDAEVLPRFPEEESGVPGMRSGE